MASREHHDEGDCSTAAEEGGSSRPEVVRSKMGFANAIEVGGHSPNRDHDQRTNARTPTAMPSGGRVSREAIRNASSRIKARFSGGDARLPKS
jgi:hypothetical protein